MNQNNQAAVSEADQRLGQLEIEQAKLKRIVLDHYHCTFFMPIVQDDETPFPAEPLEGDGRRCTYKIEKASELSELEQSKNSQAYHFFTPHLRSILFDTDKQGKCTQLQPVKEWQLPESLIREWELTLHKVKSEKALPDTPLNHQEAVFESVKLYRYFNGNYVLAFRVVPKVLREMHDFRNNEIVRLESLSDSEGKQAGELKREANNSFSLFDDKSQAQYLEDYEEDYFYEQYESLQLEAWLRFSRLARQLFPSFIEQDEEGKIAQITLKKEPGSEVVDCFDKETTPSFPETSGEQLSPIVSEILLEFFPKQTHGSIHNWLDTSLKLYDDRMFISVAYSLSGAKHDERTLKLINTLVAVTDRVDDVWKEFDNHPYSPEAMARYLEGTQFDFWKDQAAIYCYTDVINAYVSRGWFFRDIIADTHIPYIYDRMLVQALFYQTSIRYYDYAITNKTERLLEDKKGNAAETMTSLLGDFIKFTNQYWFKEVTNQMQGKEIFKLQLNGLGLDAQFAQLQDEINRTNDYLHSAYEGHQTEKSNSLALWALIIAIVALVPIINDIFKPEPSMWTSLSCWLGNSVLGQSAEVAGAIGSIWRKLLAGVLVLPIGYLAWQTYKVMKKSN